MGVVFQSPCHMDCQLFWYLVLWRTQAEWKYQTGKLPSDLLQTYCQLLEPSCLSPQWWVNAIPLGSLESMSTLIHTAVEKQNIMLRDWGIQRHERIAWKWRERRRNACTLGYGEGKTLTLYLYCCFHIILPQSITEPHLPSASYYLAGGLGALEDSLMSFTTIHSIKQATAKPGIQRSGHNRQLTSWYVLRVQSGLPIPNCLPF